LSWDLTSHNFSQPLSDLVNPGERGLASLQIFLVRVDVGLLRERRVIVARPLADDRYRHAQPAWGGRSPGPSPPPRERWKLITADGIEPGAAAVSAGADGPVHALGRRWQCGRDRAGEGTARLGRDHAAEFDSIKAKALGG
jgi:hypothetical protein